MTVWCVAVIKDSLDSAVLGYKLCDVDDPKNVDEVVGKEKCTYVAAKSLMMSTDTLKAYVNAGKLKVENLEVADDKVKFTSGTDESYAVLKKDGTFLGVGSKDKKIFTINGREKNPFVVISKIEAGEDKGVKVLLPSGRMCQLSEDAVIKDVETGGRVLSNASVVNDDGTKFIRSKRGELDKINITEPKPTVAKPATPIVPTIAKPVSTTPPVQNTANSGNTPSQKPANPYAVFLKANNNLTKQAIDDVKNGKLTPTNVAPTVVMPKQAETKKDEPIVEQPKPEVKQTEPEVKKEETVANTPTTPVEEIIAEKNEEPNKVVHSVPKNYEPWSDKDTNEFIEFATAENGEEYIKRIRLENLELLGKATHDGIWHLGFPIIHNGKPVNILESTAISFNLTESGRVRFTDEVGGPFADADNIVARYMALYVGESLVGDLNTKIWDGRKKLGEIEKVKLFTDAAKALDSLRIDITGKGGFIVKQYFKVDKNNWILTKADNKTAASFTNCLHKSLCFNYIFVPHFVQGRDGWKKVDILNSISYSYSRNSERLTLDSIDTTYHYAVFRAGSNITEVNQGCVSCSSDTDHDGTKAFKLAIDLSETNITFISKNFASIEHNVNLSWVRLNNKIIKIHESAFEGTKPFIFIPASVKEISAKAFAKCPFWKIKFAPDCKVTRIGRSAFAGGSLGSATEFNLSFIDGYVSTGTFNRMHVKSGKLDRVIIPSEVRQIGDNSISFVWGGPDEDRDSKKEKYLVHVEELSIAEGVEKIGRIQLRNYHNINVPASLTSVGIDGPHVPSVAAETTFYRPEKPANMTAEDYGNSLIEAEKITVHLDDGCKSNSYWITIANSLKNEYNNRATDLETGLKYNYSLMELDYRGSLRDKKGTKISQMLDVMGPEEVVSMASTGAENVTPFTMEELLKR